MSNSSKLIEALESYSSDIKVEGFSETRVLSILTAEEFISKSLSDIDGRLDTLFNKEPFNRVDEHFNTLFKSANSRFRFGYSNDDKLSMRDIIGFSLSLVGGLLSGGKRDKESVIETLRSEVTHQKFDEVGYLSFLEVIERDLTSLLKDLDTIKDKAQFVVDNGFTKETNSMIEGISSLCSDAQRLLGIISEYEGGIDFLIQYVNFQNTLEKSDTPIVSVIVDESGVALLSKTTEAGRIAGYSGHDLHGFLLGIRESYMVDGLCNWKKASKEVLVPLHNELFEVRSTLLKVVHRMKKEHLKGMIKKVGE